MILHGRIRARARESRNAAAVMGEGDVISIARGGTHASRIDCMKAFSRFCAAAEYRCEGADEALRRFCNVRMRTESKRGKRRVFFATLVVSAEDSNQTVERIKDSHILRSQFIYFFSL